MNSLNSCLMAVEESSNLLTIVGMNINIRRTETMQFITTPEEDVVTYELPAELTAKNIIHYSHHAKEVKGTIKNKARKFVELGLIDWDTDMKSFYVNPIPGYNSSRYEVIRRKTGFECSCQGCQSKIKRNEYDPSTEGLAACSHILAVYFWLKIKNWKSHANDTE